MSVQDPETGPSTTADEAAVDQSVGSGDGAGGGGADSDGGADSGARPVGVTAAVERGPAELSDEGEPVRDNPHASLDDVEPARSTDDL